MSAKAMVCLLRDPARAGEVRDWTPVISAARAERLLGSLAFRLEGQALPDEVGAVLEAARRDAEAGRVQALWEAEAARRALAPLGVSVILLKGTAFAAAGLEAGTGRSIGDLDILVPRTALPAVERAILAAGWEWVKEDPYDDLYYRRWMHELPPLIHRERDRMIDIHHNILPLTARPKPNPELLIGSALPLSGGLHVLAEPDMVVHAAAHLFADGDLSGGLRNLWDIDRLIRQFSQRGHEFTVELRERAWEQDLGPAVARALRLARLIFGTPVDPVIAGGARPSDRLFAARILARDGWGRPRRPWLRFAFYVRSHLLRMPPGLLAQHLWTKARR
ncbi:MAG TPA: nucleotidyltransferase family protein [Allosphingosinicella sp.]|nr:nucleotidyltransferase family protein [Allosphingosinicella sp.]